MTRSRMGEVLGVGPERVRQLAVRAAQRVDEAVDTLPAELSALAASVVRRIGAAAPIAAVDAALASIGFPALPDVRSRLLVRMAGRYHRVDRHHGWVALDPTELLGETRRILHDDGGVRLRDHVAKEVAALGVVDAHVPAWISRQPVRIVDGLVVATTGSRGDVAERALHATGRAMTIEELAAWLPASQIDVDGGLWSDRRFVFTDDGAVALAEWADPATPDRSPVPTLQIIVDDDVLAGRDGPVPRALVGALGLRRGAHRTFTTRYGPVAVLHHGDTPARGSVRPIARAVGAAVGDELQIAIYADGRDSTVTVVRRASRPHH